MYAVIRTGGKQYKVAPEDVLQLRKSKARRAKRYSFPTC